MTIYQLKRRNDFSEEDIDEILDYLIEEVALEEFAKPDAEYVDKNGNLGYINIVSYIEGTIRGIMQNVYNAFVMSYYSSLIRNDLVITNTFSDCSKACSIDQGQVRSLRGITPGVKTIEEAIMDGLFHYGSFEQSCRHIMRTYIRGTTPIPKRYSISSMLAARKVSERKRYVERQIRKYKKVGNTSKVNSWTQQPHDKNRVW